MKRRQIRQRLQRRQERRRRSQDQETVIVNGYDPETGYFGKRIITKKEKDSLILLYRR